MKRRELLLVAAGVMSTPRMLRAQQKPIPVVGYLNGTSLAANAELLAAFRKGLSEAGYDEGRNLGIEYRWAEDRYDRRL